MYDRAPRVLTTGIESTGAGVGPGTYDAVAVPHTRIKAGTVYSNRYLVGTEYSV